MPIIQDYVGDTQTLVNKTREGNTDIADKFSVTAIAMVPKNRWGTIACSLPLIYISSAHSQSSLLRATSSATVND